jgi:tight adherence protein B
VAAAGAGVVRIAERAGQERKAHERRLLVVDYCEALVGELRAGQPVTRAVERAVEVWPESEPVAAAARLNASVPDALRRVAALPGAAAVRRLAGAWEISAGTGSGLVLAVERVLETARTDDALARRVRAELASARATARLVTALPVVVLVAAQGIGAQPWQFLLDTAAGVSCLAAGVALSLVGLGWIDRVAATAVEGPA